MTSHSLPAQLRHVWLLPRHALILGIRLYQLTLSPDHGPLRHLWTYGYCRHSPTCSMYAIDVLRKRGAIVGSLLAAKRVLSCNPWAKPSDERLRELAARR